jgi:hypothetical protein
MWRKLYGTTAEDLQKCAAYSIAMWAVNASRKVGPQHPYLRQEVALVPTEIKLADSNEPDKCQGENVEEILLESPKPFSVTIDERADPPVERIPVSIMETSTNSREQMTLRIATFVDIIG